MQLALILRKVRLKAWHMEGTWEGRYRNCVAKWLNKEKVLCEVKAEGACVGKPEDTKNQERVLILYKDMSRSL